VDKNIKKVYKQDYNKLLSNLVIQKKNKRY